MSEKEILSAKEFQDTYGKPSRNPKGSKYLQNKLKVQTKPRDGSSQSSDVNNRLEALKIGQSKKITKEGLQAIKDGIDSLVLRGIDRTIREEGLSPAYVDEAPNKIKLITQGKSYLITIKEL